MNMNKVKSMNVYEWNLTNGTLTLSQKSPTDFICVEEDAITIIYKDGSEISEFVRFSESDDTKLIFQTELEIDLNKWVGIMKHSY